MQPPKVTELIHQLGTVDTQGCMHCDRVPVRQIVEETGTPLYLYSATALRRRILELRSALGPNVGLYFSIKSNPSVGVCQLMAAAGVGAELASIGELAVAKAAGFSPNSVIFAGPGKTDEELEAAARWGLDSVNVESEGELRRLAAIAERVGRKVRVSLRINPIQQLKGAQMRMGGGPNQFGIDEEVVSELAKRWRKHPWVDVVGIHVYVGTQLFDVAAMVEHDYHVVELAERVAAALEHPLELVDFGGGFAVPYFEGSADFDLAGFATGFGGIVERMRASEWLRDARPVIELGRYLVAAAGLYVTRVLDVKESRGVTYVVTDGGMNHHITATGNFGQVFRKAYPMAVLNRLNEPAECAANVVGPCCTPLDVLGQKVALPEVTPGDLIGVFYSGAYGLSASSLRFLSHPTPAEVLVNGDRWHLLRPPGSPEAVLDGQLALPPDALGA